MRPQAARWMMRLGAASVGVFCAAVVLLHVAYWNNLPRHLSSFVHMPPVGWLWTVGLLGLGFGTLSVAAGLWPSLAGGYGTRAALSFLAVGGVFVLLMAAFPTDRNLQPDHPTTPIGIIHDSAAVAATSFQCAAMYAFAYAGRRYPVWQQLTGSSTSVAHLTMALAFTWMGFDAASLAWMNSIGSLAQRVLVLLMAAWTIRLGWRALGLGATALGTPTPAPPPRPTR
jgi:hypothetical protein